MNGNLRLNAGTSSSIVGNNDLVLEQNGDTFGWSRLRIQHRNGSNGALFETQSGGGAPNLVDFGFKPGAGPQSNIRLEWRPGSLRNSGNTTYGEFQYFFGTTTTPTYAASFGTVATSFEVGNVAIGHTNPLAKFTVGTSNQEFRVNSSGDLIRINNVPYTWPTTNATATGYVLSSTTGGTLSWVDPATFLPTGAANQTLYHNGSTFVASSALQNDGTDVTVTGVLNANNGIEVTGAALHVVTNTDLDAALTVDGSVTLGDGLGASDAMSITSRNADVTLSATAPSSPANVVISVPGGVNGDLRLVNIDPYTVAVSNTYLMLDASNNVRAYTTTGVPPSGSGTAGQTTRWTSASTLGDGSLSDDGAGGFGMTGNLSFTSSGNTSFTATGNYSILTSGNFSATASGTASLSASTTVSITTGASSELTLGNSAATASISLETHTTAARDLTLEGNLKGAGADRFANRATITGNGTATTFDIPNTQVTTNSVIMVTLEDGTDANFYNWKVTAKDPGVDFTLQLNAAIANGSTKIVNYIIVNP